MISSLYWKFCLPSKTVRSYWSRTFLSLIEMQTDSFILSKSLKLSRKQSRTTSSERLLEIRTSFKKIDSINSPTSNLMRMLQSIITKRSMRVFFSMKCLCELWWIWKWYPRSETRPIENQLYLIYYCLNHDKLVDSFLLKSLSLDYKLILLNTLWMTSRA